MADALLNSAAPSAAVVPRSLLDHALSLRWSLPLLAVLLVFPWLAPLIGGDFYLGLAARVLIFALAASSLNLILGFGGMVSFGHAAFIGVGAYTVGVLAQTGISSAWVVWPVAMGVSALFALVIGAISLRTQGVYFIMITLAFAQMLYYLAVSNKAYGGDDGLSLPGRSTVGFGLDLADERTFYYVTLLLAMLAFVLMWRLLNARFGHTLQAIRENAPRMEAIGFPVYRFKLVAFSIAGALAGLAGVLLANLGSFVRAAMMEGDQAGGVLGVGYLGGGGGLLCLFFMCRGRGRWVEGGWW